MFGLETTCNNSKEEGKSALEVLQQHLESGKIVIRNGWLMCPVCGKGKVLKLREDTTAYALPVYCRRCGQESIVNIEAPEPASDETRA